MAGGPETDPAEVIAEAVACCKRRGDQDAEDYAARILAALTSAGMAVVRCDAAAGAAAPPAPPPPSLVLERAPCPQCGAVTAEEASEKCTQTQDITGEWSCPGANHEPDAEGFMRQATAASIAALDAWFLEDTKRRGWL